MWGVILASTVCVASAGHGAPGADSTITAIGFYTEHFAAERAVMTVTVQERGSWKKSLWFKVDEKARTIRAMIDSIGGPGTQTAEGITERWYQYDRKRGRDRCRGASKALVVETGDLGRFADLREALMQVPFVSIGLTEFRLSEDTLRRARLIRLATEDARRQAAAAAQQMGVRLGRPVELIVSPSASELHASAYARDNPRIYRDALRSSGPTPTECIDPVVRLSAAVKVRYVIREVLD